MCREYPRRSSAPPTPAGLGPERARHLHYSLRTEKAYAYWSCGSQLTWMADLQRPSHARRIPTVLSARRSKRFRTTCRARSPQRLDGTGMRLDVKGSLGHVPRNWRGLAELDRPPLAYASLRRPGETGKANRVARFLGPGRWQTKCGANKGAADRASIKFGSRLAARGGRRLAGAISVALEASRLERARASAPRDLTSGSMSKVLCFHASNSDVELGRVEGLA